ncbi:hypothetical protein [Oceanicaulis sp.]|uniref:hypothetical protein n=1 Tax=Oceanicaulis sp. TaxID=1924941 RepID=UPI003BA95C53
MIAKPAPLLTGQCADFHDPTRVLSYTIWPPEPCPVSGESQCLVRVSDQTGQTLCDKPIIGIDDLQAVECACTLIHVLAGLKVERQP